MSVAHPHDIVVTTVGEQFSTLSRSDGKNSAQPEY